MSNLKTRFDMFLEDIRQNLKKADSEIRNEITKVKVVLGVQTILQKVKKMSIMEKDFEAMI